MMVEGGCHCGLVRFEASVPDGPVEVLDCNCSICAMTGYLHLIVPDSRFRLVEGQRETSTYRFGSGKARHMFCTQCGIKSFYKPRSHPDGISINLRCLDEGHGLDVRVVAFDGRDWETARAGL
ncbi:GFA family protein [Sphingomonas sp.]|uniref:GFA family protein n=1 Tax=Sphingomonas sp. TaxID=28214 RepID=UPI002EDB5444